MIRRWAALSFALFTAAAPGWAAIQMSSWMSYQVRHEETLNQYGSKFTSICVFAYDFDESDNIRPAQPWVDSTLATLMATPHPARPVFITIVNDIESSPPQQHNGDLILRVLSDPIKRQQHIQQIVALSQRADGIDIDYEGLLQGTRPYYTAFIQELRAALPPGKLLSAVCQPKTDNADGPRGQAIDWEAIAPSVDILKVMTYYYSFGGTTPGPSAPLDKVRDVTALAVSEVPASKLHVVLTQFGWDWPANGPGQFLDYAEAIEIASSHGVIPVRDPGSQYLRINYSDGTGVPHEIWVPDNTALQAQMSIIQSFGVNKIDTWELGVGDPVFWEWVAQNTENPNLGPGAPTLASLTPNSTLFGSPGFSLIVNGSNFTTNAQAQWNGQNRPTTFVSPTLVTVAVADADLATPDTASVTVINPENGGGTSNALPFVIIGPNPVPVASSLNPPTVLVGSPGFLLTVSGSNFVNGSVIRWGGSDRPTTFVDEHTLRAQINASDVATLLSVGVTVFNPAPGGGLSNELTFTTTPTNPAPQLFSLNPSTVPAGGAAFTLTVTGANFSPSSVVRWNGADRLTSFVSGTTLTALIFADDITTVGGATVRVFTPEPGGGESEPRGIAIVPPPPIGENPSPTSGPVASNLDHVRAFPNPWAADRHKGSSITFDQLTAGATVKLFTMSSRWVKSLSADNGRVVWDMTNDSGQSVASGYYFYLITDPDGHKSQGKVAIIK